MKTLFRVFLGLFLCSSIPSQALLESDYCCETPCYLNTCCEEPSCNMFSIEAQYAAMFPLNSTVCRIYGYALPQFTLELNWNWKCFSVWLDGSYVFANGKAVPCGGSTHLNFVPITLGVRYFYSVCHDTDLYLGIGACYSFLNTRDHSPYVHEKTSANNAGAIVKSGFVYRVCDGIFFEGFLNYMYQKFYFHKYETEPFVYRNDVDMSSLQLGVAIGWEF